MGKIGTRRAAALMTPVTQVAQIQMKSHLEGKHGSRLAVHFNAFTVLEICQRTQLVLWAT